MLKSLLSEAQYIFDILRFKFIVLIILTQHGGQGLQNGILKVAISRWSVEVHQFTWEGCWAHCPLPTLNSALLFPLASYSYVKK